MFIKQISLNADKLIDFQQWKKAKGDDFSLWDYLFGSANIEIAIAFTKLFWPDFVEHEGRFQVKCDRDEHTVVVTFFQEN